eukprot:g13006.t1
MRHCSKRFGALVAVAHQQFATVEAVRFIPSAAQREQAGFLQQSEKELKHPFSGIKSGLYRFLAKLVPGMGGADSTGSVQMPTKAELDAALEARKRMEEEDPTLFAPSSPVTKARYLLARVSFGHTVAGVRAPTHGMPEEEENEIRAGNSMALEGVLEKIKGEAPANGRSKEQPTNWAAQSSREVADGPEMMLLEGSAFQMAWLKAPQQEAVAAADAAAVGVTTGGDLEAEPAAASSTLQTPSSTAPRKIMLLLENNGYDPRKRSAMEFADLVPVALSKGIDVIVPWILPQYLESGGDTKNGELIAQLLDAAAFVLGLQSVDVDLNLVVADSMTGVMASALPQMETKFGSLVFMNPAAPLAGTTDAAGELQFSRTDLRAIANRPTLLMQGLMAAVEAGENKAAKVDMTSALENWLRNVDAYYGPQFAMQVHKSTNAHQPFNAVKNQTLLNEKWVWNFNAAKEGGEIDHLHNLMMIHPAARNMYRAEEATHTIDAYVKKDHDEALVHTTGKQTLTVGKREASWVRLEVAERVTNFVEYQAVLGNEEPSPSTGAAAEEEEGNSSSSCACDGEEKKLEDQNVAGCCDTKETDNKLDAPKEEAKKPCDSLDSSCSGPEEEEAAKEAAAAKPADEKAAEEESSSCGKHEEEKAAEPAKEGAEEEGSASCGSKEEEKEGSGSCGKEEEEASQAGDAASEKSADAAKAASFMTMPIPPMAK